MAAFKSFKDGTITILEDVEDEQKEGTTLTVYPSLTGPFAFKTPFYGSSTPVSQWTHAVNHQVASFRPSKSGNEELSSDVLMLKSAHCDEEAPTASFKLLNDSISNNSARWGTFRTNGGFTYTECYWEWVEDVLSRNKDRIKKTGLYRAVFASLFSYDRFPPVVRAFCEYWCPATNTLHTSQGEMSISLLDLQHIGGLPILGRFYDEVVPAIAEFSAKSKEGELLIPKSCRYLFLAYHRLCKRERGNVKIATWIQYWYKGEMRYKRPPTKSTRNKRDPPTNTHDPSGAIPGIRRRTPEDLLPFEDLGVEEASMESVYLSAFYVCWLCLFVFPKTDPGFIRPGVFKIAHRMARGQHYCLAVPVLANIYQGLNAISVSSDPGSCPTVLPFHYLYGWLGEYFSTHFFSRHPENFRPLMVHISGELSARNFDDERARALFTACDNVRMGRFAKVSSARKLIVDTHEALPSDSAYLISLRSGFVSLRQDSWRVVEPYNPHRFSRQFGYVQGVPGDFQRDSRPIPLTRTYSLWDSLTKLGTKGEVILPMKSDITKFMVTQDYIEWWSKVHHSASKRPMKITIVNLPQQEPPKAKGDDRATTPLQILVSAEALPPVDNYQIPPPPVLEGIGDSADFHPKSKEKVATSRRHSRSSSSAHSDVHFKR